RGPASRIFWTAGISSPISRPMMAITTRISISVNPARTRAFVTERCITALRLCRGLKPRRPPPPSDRPFAPAGHYTSLAEAFQKSQHRQEQGDYDRPDDPAEDDDHDRLEQ